MLTDKNRQALETFKIFQDFLAPTQNFNNNLIGSFSMEVTW